jgi:hypothetical protein
MGFPSAKWMCCTRFPSRNKPLQYFAHLPPGNQFTQHAPVGIRLRGHALHVRTGCIRLDYTAGVVQHQLNAQLLRPFWPERAWIIERFQASFARSSSKPHPDVTKQAVRAKFQRVSMER